MPDAGPVSAPLGPPGLFCVSSEKGLWLAIAGLVLLQMKGQESRGGARLRQ